MNIEAMEVPKVAHMLERTTPIAPQQSRIDAPEPGGGPDATLRQYSLVRILAVWAAAAVPMGLLAWVIAPWLKGRLDGPEPMAQALFLVLTAGLVWQFILVLVLVWRDQGSLAWSKVRPALWVRTPRDPRSGRVGGRVWLWLIPFILIFAAEQFLPSISGPASRDFGAFMDTGGGEDFFRGAWGWFGLVVVMAIFNTVLGEELLFRGLLLPRMRGVFGRGDWLANGVLFALYHVHVPWVMPTALLDALALAYPSRRFRSVWMGIIIHSAQSVFIVLAVLVAVLG